MRLTPSSSTIVSLGVGLVVAASIVGGVAYATRPTVVSLDQQLQSSASQRVTASIGDSALDSGWRLEHWVPVRVPMQTARDARVATVPQPAPSQLAQVTKPAAQVNVPSVTARPTKPQVVAASEKDDSGNSNVSSNGESQESGD